MDGFCSLADSVFSLDGSFFMTSDISLAVIDQSAASLAVDNLQIIHSEVTSIDTACKLVHLSNGKSVEYSRLCICAGARPKVTSLLVLLARNMLQDTSNATGPLDYWQSRVNTSCTADAHSTCTFFCVLPSFITAFQLPLKDSLILRSLAGQNLYRVARIPA
jgi:hypothetical protein